uniref:DUF538 domain-containing protein n=1 Tax=Picea sitchensis TaxID=3332 RepID=A9NSC8_PICSI|nr:unknown [Picea sitchensis]ABR17183.1 unknown [Picea sitchensis]
MPVVLPLIRVFQFNSLSVLESRGSVSKPFRCYSKPLISFYLGLAFKQMESRPWLSLILLLMIVMVGGLAEAEETIYDVLKKNGLPEGLLPKGVKSYALNDEGQLEVYLEKPCYAKFENQVYFERMIRGNLSYGQLAGVAGVEQQELFLWFPVKGIRVDIPNSGFIYFDVGVVYKQFSLSLFETPPDCREGDHNNNKDHLAIQQPTTHISDSDYLHLQPGSDKAVRKRDNIPRRAAQ